MCDCQTRVHPDFECGTEQCHCHDEFVYMTISFLKVHRDTAQEILTAALARSGLSAFAVYYDKAIEPDEEEQWKSVSGS